VEKPRRTSRILERTILIIIKLIERTILIIIKLMKVIIELFGASRDFSNQNLLELDVANDSTIKDVRNKILDYLNINFKGNENFIKIV